MEHWRLGVDAALVATIALLAWRTRRGIAKQPEDGASAAIARLEARVDELEKAGAQWRERAETQLRVLIKICDQARVILERGRLQPTRFTSDEAMELRQMAPRVNSGAASPASVPSRREWNETRARLGAEAAVNLKTLLRDHFA